MSAVFQHVMRCGHMDGGNVEFILYLLSVLSGTQKIQESLCFIFRLTLKSRTMQNLNGYEGGSCGLDDWHPCGGVGGWRPLWFGTWVMCSRQIFTRKLVLLPHSVLSSIINSSITGCIQARCVPSAQNRMKRKRDEEVL